MYSKIVPILLILCIYNIGFANYNGTNSLTGLEFNITAGGQGVGNAYTTDTNSVSSIIYNPALIPFWNKTHTGAVHQLLPLNINKYNQYLFITLSGSFPLFINVSSLFVTDLFKTDYSLLYNNNVNYLETGYDVPVPVEKYSLLFNNISFSTGIRFGVNSHIGLTTHILYNKIDEYSNYGILFDFGLLFNNRRSMSLVPDKIGITFKNIGKVSSFIERSDDLSAMIQLNSKYIFSLPGSNILFNIYGQLDLDYINTNALIFGAEMFFKDIVIFRLGYKFTDNSSAYSGLTLGIGSSVKDFSFDYALSFLKTQYLSSKHTFGFSYKFDFKKKKKIVIEKPEVEKEEMIVVPDTFTVIEPEVEDTKPVEQPLSKPEVVEDTQTEPITKEMIEKSTVPAEESKENETIDKARELMEMGDKFFGEDEYEQAITYYYRALELNPPFKSEIHQKLGDAYFSNGQLLKANEEYRKAAE